MERRRFLAATVTAGALPLAGCAARRTAIPAAEVEHEDDDHYLVYHDGDDRIAVVSYAQRQRVAGPPPYGLWLTVSHAESTTVDALRVELDTAPGERPKPPVYLEAPDGHPYPELHYHTDLNTGAAVVDIPDTEKQGSGAMSLEFLVVSRSGDPVTVVGETSLTLSGRRVIGREYELSDRIEFELTG